MRRTLQSLFVVAAGLAFVVPVVTPRPAQAESRLEEHLTLGWQTEHADAVLVAVPRTEGERGLLGRLEVEFDVRETLVGEIAAGETLTVLLDDRGHGVAFRPGERHLVFLRERQLRPDRVTFEPVSGAFSIRTLVTGEASERFPGLVTELADALGRTGTQDDAELRRDLVRWVADEDPGIAWSAALDILRRDDLHAGLTANDRETIVEAFADQPVGKATKRALAQLAGRVGGEDAIEPLVQSLADERSLEFRSDVVDALSVVNRPGRVETRLLAAAEELPGRSGRHVLHALGRLGSSVARDALATAVSGDDPVLRIEAAHALGLLGRRVRAEDPDARIVAEDELRAALELSDSENEYRAVCWALAQLDRPAAYEVLREARRTDDRERVRHWADSYLTRPRQSLILRR